MKEYFSNLCISVCMVYAYVSLFKYRAAEQQKSPDLWLVLEKVLLEMIIA